MSERSLPKPRSSSSTSAPVLLLLLLLTWLCLVCDHGIPRASAGLVTPEDEAKAQKLLSENLKPVLDWWAGHAAATGKKLTMQNYFKTAKFNFKTRFANYWGVKDGKVFIVNKNGEARYSNELMMKEGVPNAGAAEALKNPMWLAIEDAINHGVKMPDVMFVFNTADHPLCWTLPQQGCNDPSFAPPISIMGLDPAKLETDRPPTDPHSLPSVFGDFLTPMFRAWLLLTTSIMTFPLLLNLGYSRQPTVGSEGYHPRVLNTSRINPGRRAHVTHEGVAWEERAPVMFFRGTNYCPHIKLKVPQLCPRIHLTNLSIHHPDKLNILTGSLPEDVREELRQHQIKLPGQYAMAEWKKFKYIVSIDGLAGSSRVLPLFYTGSVVVRQQSSPYMEWYYRSVKEGEHFETIFKQRPDGSRDYDDAPALVDHLRSNDSYARSIAENGLTFAHEYLNKEVMLIYLREMLIAYKNLFEDMDEYMRTALTTILSTDNSTIWENHVKNWQIDWRTLR